MRTIPDSYVSRVLFALPRPACGFEAIASRWRRLKTTLLDPYRPELHYARNGVRSTPLSDHVASQFRRLP